MPEQTTLEVIAGQLGQIAGLLKSDRRTRRLVGLFLALFVASVLLFTWQIRGVTRSTNKAVRQEVPGLQKQIADRDKTIADYKDVTDQAVGWIGYMAKDIVRLGGTPPLIELKPGGTGPPTTTTTP